MATKYLDHVIYEESKTNSNIIFSVTSGDESENGRRSALDDPKLKIKTVSESPEIRNLAEDDGSGSESDDGTTNSSEAGSSNKTTAAASTGTSASTNNLNDCKKLSNNCTSCCAKRFNVFACFYFMFSFVFWCTSKENCFGKLQLITKIWLWLRLEISQVKQNHMCLDLEVVSVAL